jgi:Carboxypeptidase regulatory-like domain
MKFFGLLGLLGMAASMLPAQSTVTVEGVVVDSVTGAGISGCTVRLFYIGGGVADGVVNVLMREIPTNEAGDFRATGLKPGDYTALAQKQGYSGTRPVQFHVDADGSPMRPRLELTPLATLRGRVLGIDGRPARASVELGPGARDRVSTDEDGYFTFERLTPGSYTLLGRPETAEPVSTQEGSRTEVAPTYYPSTVQRFQAESITVRPGAEQTGYEIRLQSAPVYRVSGVVFEPAGKPAPDVLVQLGNGTAAG